MAKTVVGKTVESLGEYLRDQRLTAQLSLRQLAEQAGVSNPYLSQIEHGLRKPSAEVLQQIARALRISAEQLYLRAGIVSPDVAGDTDGGVVVEAAIRSDPGLTDRQRESLIEVYQSFRRVTRETAEATDDRSTVEPPEQLEQPERSAQPLRPTQSPLTQEN